MRQEFRNKKKQFPRLIRTIIGLFLFSAGLTLLFLGMRAVMMVGGFCAEGGPYEIAVPCPKGITTLMPLSIVSMLIGCALYFFSHLENGPRWGFLAWSALFISLGWNFMEFALYPPQGGDVVISWIVCGVLFIVMGVGPLFLLLTVNPLEILFGLNQPRSKYVKRSSTLPRSLIFVLHILITAVGIYFGLHFYAQFTR